MALNRQGSDYYDPYRGFNRLDPLDVYNYSLISRLVGRQKFEKKGANPGGGGSSLTQIRNLFKYVSYWNPSIIPDKKGRAEIEFEVPDNLTGWRILAFATTEEDRMGLGQHAFKVNQPTELRPVMPNQVTEGDSFNAGFSVMNRTDKTRELAVQVAVDGPILETSQQNVSEKITVEPFKRKNIWLPVKTKQHGELKFTAIGGDKLDSDGIHHTVPVNKRRSLQTAATYGTFTGESVSESVKIPQGIFTDSGYIGAVVSPTVIGNLDGAFNYLSQYPYFCWEQRLSKAVGAHSYIQLKDYLDEETIWQEPKTLIKNTLENASNFQAPNGGMTYWIPTNQNVSPYLSAYTAIAFQWLRNSGYEVPTLVEDKLHQYLLTMLRRDVFPTFFDSGMSSSVRAVALAALAESGKINKSDVKRYQNFLPEMDLFGKSFYLKAATLVDGVAEKTIESTVNSILGYATQTGGKFQFNEPWDDSYKYILSTPLRSNCSILTSLLDVQKNTQSASLIGDVPFKLVRAITQSRGNRDHWENTQENVFCLNALIDYASMYELEDPEMSIEVSIGDEQIGAAQFIKKNDPMVTLSRTLNAEDEGAETKVNIKKLGSGRLYYSARLAYAEKEDNAERINSGIEVRREYSVERDGKFELLSSPMEVKRGELIRVDLFVSVPTARHFVVVDDPVPGGLEPVNSDLATTSSVDAEKAQVKWSKNSWYFSFSDWSFYGRYFWSFYHRELRHDSARFYADYLPAGNYFLSYTAQAIAEGEFSVMPVHVEEMYDPDVYGKGLPATLNVVNQ